MSARAPELDAQIRAMSAEADSDRDSIEFTLAEESTNPTLPFALILVSAVGQTDVGRRREHNEDSYLALPEHHLFAIADGMGGHAAGEVASRIAVESIAHAFEQTTFVGEPDSSRPWRGDQLVRAILGANTEVFARGQADESLRGMGTTLVAARFSPNKQRVYIAHVGDSRCYRARRGELVQLTTDHTAAQLGVKGREAHRLIRAVGVWEHIEVDLLVDSPEPDDTYLLCSDGLSKMVPDTRILDLIGDGHNLEDSCRALVDAANQRGGLDNVTVILVGVQRAVHLATAVPPRR
jgi:protein phosphatase